MNNSQQVFINTAQACELIGVSRTTLYRWKTQAIHRLYEGIHYVNPTPKSTLFNKFLLLDYVDNITTPSQHQKTIERYLRARDKGKQFAIA